MHRRAHDTGSYLADGALRERGPYHEMRNAAGEFNYFEGLVGFANSLVPDLPVQSRHEFDQFINPRVHGGFELEEHMDPIQGRSLGPSRGSSFC